MGPATPVGGPEGPNPLSLATHSTTLISACQLWGGTRHDVGCTQSRADGGGQSLDTPVIQPQLSSQQSRAEGRGQSLDTPVIQPQLSPQQSRAEGRGQSLDTPVIQPQLSPQQSRAFDKGQSLDTPVIQPQLSQVASYTQPRYAFSILQAI